MAVYSIIFFNFRWRCWWRVGEVVIMQTNYQGCHFGVHCIQCQTSTYILGIMNECVQFVQNYVQYVYIPINSQLVIKTVENHDRNQKIKGTFICWPLFFKWMGVSQSWWDSFSIGIWAFIQNISFSSSVVFIYWCPFVTILLQFAVSLHFFSSASNCIRYFPSSLQ